jgi:hypothetical protein
MLKSQFEQVKHLVCLGTSFDCIWNEDTHKASICKHVTSALNEGKFFVCPINWK